MLFCFTPSAVDLYCPALGSRYGGIGRRARLKNRSSAVLPTFSNLHRTSLYPCICWSRVIFARYCQGCLPSMKLAQILTGPREGLIPACRNASRRFQRENANAQFPVNNLGRRSTSSQANPANFCHECYILHDYWTTQSNPRSGHLHSGRRARQPPEPRNLSWNQGRSPPFIRRAEREERRRELESSLRQSSND
jgi:hypothetical protein